MNNNIRLAKKSELWELARLDQRVNQTPWSVSQYEECLANKKHSVYVLEVDSVIAGLIAVSVVFDEVEILQLAIDYTYQNKKLATFLVTEVLKLLYTKYLIRIVFLEVCVHNSVALALYKKIGFKQISMRRDYYVVNGDRFDACVMTLDYTKFDGE